MNDDLEAVARETLETIGLELFDVSRGGSRERPVVRVRIDRLDGAAVTVDDCARASRALEERLDADGRYGERYVLEVSSPGVERPLRHADDWRRFVGRRASVVSDALGGRADVEIRGVGGEQGEEWVIVEPASGHEHRIPLADVREARLAFHWTR